MRFIVIFILALVVFGICGLVGGIAVLWLGSLLARIDAFGITTFQGAVICVGFAIASAIILSEFLAASLSPLSAIRSLLNAEDQEYDEEEDDFPVARVRRQKKRR